MFGWFTNAVLELWEMERPIPRLPRARTSRRRFRQRLFWRDNGMCAYCDRFLTFDESTIDEVVPQVLGGPRRMDNSVLSCRKCNNKKGALQLEDPTTLSVDMLRQRWASLDTVRVSELKARKLPD